MQDDSKAWKQQLVDAMRAYEQFCTSAVNRLINLRGYCSLRWTGEEYEGLRQQLRATGTLVDASGKGTPALGQQYVILERRVRDIGHPRKLRVARPLYIDEAGQRFEIKSVADIIRAGENAQGSVSSNLGEIERGIWQYDVTPPQEQADATAKGEPPQAAPKGEACPRWLADLAWEINEVIRRYDALSVFRDGVDGWLSGMEDQSRYLADWEKRFAGYVDKVRKTPELRNSRAFQTDPASGSTPGGLKWHPLPVFGEQLWCWAPEEFRVTPETRPRYAFPLPLPVDRGLSEAERYAALAAVHDLCCEGQDKIGPWLQPGRFAERRDESRYWMYRRSLVEHVPKLKESALLPLKALLQEVERDLARLKSQDAGTPAKRSKPERSVQKTWTRPECPSCLKPGLTWITRKEFAKRSGIKAETVKLRVDEGAFISRADKKIPWCETCKEMTPEGSGDDVRPDSAFEPTEADNARITEWAYEALRPFGHQKHLPPSNKLAGFVPNDELQETALECFHVAVEAIGDFARQHGGLPENPSEAVGAAVDAIKAKRGKDARMSHTTIGNMDTFSRQSDGKTPWRTERESEASGRNSDDLPED